MMIVSPVTEAVKNFAAVNFTLSRKQARDHLGLTGNQISRAFDNLLRQGRLRRIGYGLYQFIEIVDKPPMEVEDKIWRAMRVSTTFSAADIAKLAESTTSYVYKRFRHYRAEGYLKEGGVRRTHGSGQAKLWRLTLKGKDKARNPEAEAWSPDAFILAAVNLNRLVCSGVAVRDRAAAKEALSQVALIRQRLEEVIEET